MLKTSLSFAQQFQRPRVVVHIAASTHPCGFVCWLDPAGFQSDWWGAEGNQPTAFCAHSSSKWDIEDNNKQIIKNDQRYSTWKAPRHRTFNPASASRETRPTNWISDAGFYTGITEAKPTTRDQRWNNTSGDSMCCSHEHVQRIIPSLLPVRSPQSSEVSLRVTSNMLMKEN